MNNIKFHHKIIKKYFGTNNVNYLCHFKNNLNIIIFKYKFKNESNIWIYFSMTKNKFVKIQHYKKSQFELLKFLNNKYLLESRKQKLNLF